MCKNTRILLVTVHLCFLLDVYLLNKTKKFNLNTKKCPFQLSQYSLTLSASQTTLVFKINITRAYLKKT